MTTEQIDDTGAVADVWGARSPWEIDREKREAADKVAEAVKEEERRKASWVDMTTRPNEWLQIVNRQEIPDNAVRIAIALASFGGNGNTQGVFPTIETLTDMVPKKRRTVSQGVADLKKADLIREQSRAYNGPVTYRLGAMPESS
jgi:hypothetical protein